MLLLVHEEVWWSLETGTDGEDKGECGREGGRGYKETQTCGKWKPTPDD